MKLSELSSKLSLVFAGDDFEVTALNTLDDALPCEVSFLENTKYISSLENTKAGAVFVHPKQAHLVPKTAIALITHHPYLTLAFASKYFAKPCFEENGEEAVVDKTAFVHKSATVGFGAVIGENCKIGAGCVIGDFVVIGAGTTIYPNVTIYRDCMIGSNCVIHAGTVIGSDGFGFAHTNTGEHIKIYQNGIVRIEDSVEIGSNCAIDRAAFGETVIKKGTKIDNLVQIAHNVIIGENSLLAGQVGLSGSTILGKNVVMGGQSASAGHLKIGDFATIAGRGGVTKSIEGGKTYAGFPIMEHRSWLKLQAKLSKMNKEHF